MRNTTFAKSALTILALSVSSAVYAGDPGYYSGYELSKDAQVTMDEASTIALQLHPRGVITNRALEREPGGTGLRYTFELRAEAQLFQVGVDAGSGDVIENQAEMQNPY